VIKATKTMLAGCVVAGIAAGCQSTVPDMPAPVSRAQPIALEPEEVEEAIDAIRDYEFGESRVPLSRVESLVRQSQYHDGDRTMIAGMLAKLLRSNNATVDAKRFALRELYVIATQAEIPAIGAELTDPDLADLARYALESIPGDEVNKVFISALGTAPDDIKIGLINSLGRRRAYSALSALRPLRQSPNPTVAAAADYAVGRIEGFIIP